MQFIEARHVDVTIQAEIMGLMMELCDLTWSQDQERIVVNVSELSGAMGVSRRGKPLLRALKRLDQAKLLSVETFWNEQLQEKVTIITVPCAVRRPVRRGEVTR